MSDAALLALMRQIAAGDRAAVARTLKDLPDLASSGLTRGATRAGTQGLFLDAIRRVLYAGDTALHVAAAAHDASTARLLVKLGAHVNAPNRRGATPLHSAAVGAPGALQWKPRAQVATIDALIRAGAVVNSHEPGGATPLHRAVRTRSSAAVAALLRHGADPAGTETLVRFNTGRSGSGSPAAKAELEKIVRLLGQAR